MPHPQNTTEFTIFPGIMGNEEETGLLVTRIGDWEEPRIQTEELAQYVPEELVFAYTFLSNGYKIYVGGGKDLTTGDIDHQVNLERCTPEGRSPSQVTKFILGSQILLEKVVSKYVTKASLDSGETVEARIQRRVAASAGSRKGCHDNFYLGNSPVLGKAFEHNRELQLPRLTDHLSARSFVTGAGLVTPHKTRFAQKIGGLESSSEYGYKGSMWREDYSQRLEVRCNDINISDWATLVRIGSTSMLLALMETPLREELITEPKNMDQVIAEAQVMNRLELNRDGHIESFKELVEAVDYEQKIAELVLDKLLFHTDQIPDEYFEIAQELYKYCDDFRKVLAGEQTIEILADRADWAAKLMLILLAIDKDTSFGITRDMNDTISQATDYYYDYIGMSATDGLVTKPTYGAGYKLRAMGRFKKTVSDTKAKQAYLLPPDNTRAKIRSDLIKNYDVSGCDWDKVVLYTGEGENTEEIQLEDPFATELATEQLKILSPIKKAV